MAAGQQTPAHIHSGHLSCACGAASAHSQNESRRIHITTPQQLLESRCTPTLHRPKLALSTLAAPSSASTLASSSPADTAVRRGARLTAAAATSHHYRRRLSPTIRHRCPATPATVGPPPCRLPLPTLHLSRASSRLVTPHQAARVCAAAAPRVWPPPPPHRRERWRPPRARRSP